MSNFGMIEGLEFNKKLKMASKATQQPHMCMFKHATVYLDKVVRFYCVMPTELKKTQCILLVFRGPKHV